ncbi:hypothetical protein GCM10022381_24980 [Leifsonia kafniensis]|uniref:DUF11 domain-containing protein n=1 Tax=Leifsonia kafniensis TaxID=475957 RepID=A0ABP7KLD9_9MICO
MKIFTLSNSLTRTVGRAVGRAAGMGAAIGLLAVAVVGVAASPVQAAEALPELSVSLSNSSEEAAPESDLNYVAVVENLGSAAAELRVVVTVPDFAEIVSATDATVEGHTASWTVTVEPGAPVSVTTSVHIGTIAADVLWANATAGVFSGDSTDAVVATADVDPVAGTEAVRADVKKAAEKALAEHLASEGGNSLFGSAGYLIPVLIGGSVAVVLLIVAALILKSRSRRRAAPVNDESDTAGSRRAARSGVDLSA